MIHLYLLLFAPIKINNTDDYFILNELRETMKIGVWIDHEQKCILRMCYLLYVIKYQTKSLGYLIGCSLTSVASARLSQ